jgi:UDP-glucose 4-epimerase
MQTRSFCDVRDTVAILDALADTPTAHGEVVNVGNDRHIRIRQLAELIRQRCGSSSPLEFVPTAKAYGHEFNEIPQRRPILEKMRSLIGYRHKWSLEETIDDLINRSRQAPNLALQAAE